MIKVVRTSRTLLIVALAAFAAGCSENSSTSPVLASDAEGSGKHLQSSESISQYITNAVNEVLPGATILSAIREEENGKVQYDIEAEIDGVRWELELSGDGAITGMEIDDGDNDEEHEEAIAIDALPVAVVDAVNGAVAGGTLISAEMETENGQLVYEVEVEANGTVFEVEVAEDGTVIEVEEDEDEQLEEENEGDDDDDEDDDEEENDEDDEQLEEENEDED